ncbi:MAG: hypothetical protein MJ233_00320 [Mycoplasmoidaceae bacterium]|nr:hypothetical protein [Mycoplasmoidaceae bacterium]
MKQGMITKIKLGDLSIKLASSFFRFSCTLYTTYRYSEEFTMTNKFISFTDVPIECYVDTDSNYDVDKIYFGVDIEKLCDDND